MLKILWNGMRVGSEVNRMNWKKFFHNFTEKKLKKINTNFFFKNGLKQCERIEEIDILNLEMEKQKKKFIGIDYFFSKKNTWSNPGKVKLFFFFFFCKINKIK